MYIRPTVAPRASSRVQLHLKQFLVPSTWWCFDLSEPDGARSCKQCLTSPRVQRQHAQCVPSGVDSELVMMSRFTKHRIRLCKIPPIPLCSESGINPPSATQIHVVAIWQARTADPGKRAVHSSPSDKHAIPRFATECDFPFRFESEKKTGLTVSDRSCWYPISVVSSVFDSILQTHLTPPPGE